MKPIKFKGQNCIFAEDQPEYIPLPVCKGTNGQVTSVWELSDEKRKQIAKGGKICLCQSTFNKALQPVNLWVDDTIEEID